LYFAENAGVEIRPEREVIKIRQLANGQSDRARFEIQYKSSTALFHRPVSVVRSRNVVVAAGVLGTVELLLNCRDVLKTLPDLSQQLGRRVRTNSEAFVGAFNTKMREDHSKGIAISSIVRADNDTQIEPVRFSDKSSLIFWILSTPIIKSGGIFIWRLIKIILEMVKKPSEFINLKIKPGLTKRGIALMIMQTKDNLMSLGLGRNLYTFFKRGLVPKHDEQKLIPVDIDLGYQVVNDFSHKIKGFSIGTVPEELFNAPTTAHMLGGCLMGTSEENGVIDENFQAFNYPGLYIIDGSVIPANPGVNPSLTITAFAEYAMSRIPERANTE
jgi:cholesterol oxidase